MPWVLWHGAPRLGWAPPAYARTMQTLGRAGGCRALSPQLSPGPRCQLPGRQAEGLQDCGAAGPGSSRQGSGAWRQPRAGIAFGLAAPGPSPDQGGVSPLRAGARGAGLAP